MNPYESPREVNTDASRPSRYRDPSFWALVSRVGVLSFILGIVSLFAPIILLGKLGRQETSSIEYLVRSAVGILGVVSVYGGLLAMVGGAIARVLVKPQ